MRPARSVGDAAVKRLNRQPALHAPTDQRVKAPAQPVDLDDVTNMDSFESHPRQRTRGSGGLSRPHPAFEPPRSWRRRHVPPPCHVIRRPGAPSRAPGRQPLARPVGASPELTDPPSTKPVARSPPASPALIGASESRARIADGNPTGATRPAGSSVCLVPSLASPARCRSPGTVRLCVRPAVLRGSRVPRHCEEVALPEQTVSRGPERQGPHGRKQAGNGPNSVPTRCASPGSVTARDTRRTHRGVHPSALVQHLPSLRSAATELRTRRCGKRHQASVEPSSPIPAARQTPTIATMEPVSTPVSCQLAPRSPLWSRRPSAMPATKSSPLTANA